jgi:hypothetical protein
MNAMDSHLLAKTARVRALAERARASVARVIVGKAEVIDLLLVALPGEGHVLVEDVPGIGKTLLTKALARTRGTPRSAPSKRTSTAPGRTPARSSTTASGTPAQTAVLTAPCSHGSPSGIGAICVRLLPAHSSVQVSVRLGSARSASSVRLSGRSTSPSTRSRQAAGSMAGVGKLLRT